MKAFVLLSIVAAVAASAANFVGGNYHAAMWAALTAVYAALMLGYRELSK